MIDLTRETLIPIERAAEHRLLRNLGEHGKPPGASTLYRWANEGCRGVKLETVKAPRLATSEAAVERFIAKLNEPKSAPARARGLAKSEHAQAENYLASLGI